MTRLLRMAVSAAIALALLVGAEARAAMKLAGVAVPPSVNIGGDELSLNGAALQARFIFDVSVVSFYAPGPVRTISEAVSPTGKKMLRFHLLRNLSQGQLHSVVEQGLAIALGNRVETVRAQTSLFLKALPAVRRGDVMSITFVPGEGTTLRINDEARVTIDDAEFSEAIFSVWLGPRSIDRGVQKGLLPPRQ